jgi:hypothetical protein
MLRSITTISLLGVAHSAYDSCNLPIAEWAGLNQAEGNGGLYGAAYNDNHVYIAGYQAGNFAFHSANKDGDTTGDHDATDHTTVQVEHETGSHTDPDENGDTTPHPSEQNGWDAVVTKIDMNGEYQGIFAVDTYPVDGKFDDTSLNSGWGGYSYFTDLDSGDKDSMVVAGSFRGKLTFPVAADDDAVTLENAKWQKYDAFITKYDVTTQKVLWATGEKLQRPTCNQNTDGTPDSDCDEPTSVGGSIAVTGDGHVVATSNYNLKGRNTDRGRVLLFNGATGANVWEKQLGTSSLTFGTEAIGNIGYVVGRIEGVDVDPFEIGANTTSCGDGSSASVLIAAVDATADGTGETTWQKSFGCGTAASIVADPSGNHLYVGGHIDEAEEGAPYAIGDSCSLTGKFGGFLMKIKVEDGECVWATDTPPVGYYSTRWGFRYHGLDTDGTYIWTLKSDDSPMTFSDDLTVPVRGSSDDGFLAKYDCADGAGLWALSIGGAGDDNLIDVVNTGNGILIAGTTKSAEISLGDVTIQNLQHDRSYADSDAPGLNAGYNAHFAMLIHDEAQISCIDSCDSGKTTDATLKSGFCLVGSTCVADGDMYEYKPCFQCTAATSTTELQGPITDNHCYIDEICVPTGTNKPSYTRYNQNSVCEVCQPTVDTSGFSLLAGHFHDREFAVDETGGGTRGCHSGFNQISKYGVVFEMQSNGCQVLPDMTVTATVDSSAMTHDQMSLEAVKAVQDATKDNKGAEHAWLYYHGDSATCTKASVSYTQEGATKTHSDLCAGTPALKADEMAEAFETILFYGQSMARVKVQQGLMILKAELNNDADAAKIVDLKQDIVAHIMISAYQGVIHHAHQMTVGSDKAAAQAEATKYWDIIHPHWNAGADKTALANMFDTATAPTGDFHYCGASEMLKRNMPASSAWHYGSADTDCGTEHGGGRGSSRPSLDHSFALVDANHTLETALELGKNYEATQHESNMDRLYLSHADLGTLKAALNEDMEAPTCTMPPPPPPPPAPSFPPTTHGVSCAFSAAGDVSDYDEAKQEGIKGVLADAANVPSSAVTLDIKAGSVIITATIAVSDGEAASTVSTALSAGILSSEATLQAAFTAAGVTGVTVEAITAAPSAVSLADEGLTTGELAGIAVAGAVGGIILIGIIYMVLLKKRTNKPIFYCLEELNPKEKQAPAGSGSV